MEPETKHTIEGSSSVQLPEELLPNVLRFLDVQQRMRNAALVSKAWHAAADAATTCVSVTITDRDVEDTQSNAPKHHSWSHKRDALAAWLAHEHNSQNVTSICVEAANSVLEAELDRDFVPVLLLQPAQLQHLCSLNLSGCCLSVKLEPAAAFPAARGRQRKASSSAGPAAPLAPLAGTLTALEIKSIKFGMSVCDTSPADVDILSCLAVLTSLQRLRICEAFTVGRHTLEGVGIALCKLPQLTHLLLDSVEDSDEAFEMVAAAGALQQLQELELRYNGSHACYMRHLGKDLPCSITRLKVVGARNMRVTAEGSPDLIRLTSLRHLELHAIRRFAAAALASRCDTLTHLSLESIDKLRSRHLSALVRMLPQLQQLQHLRVWDLACEPIHLSPRDSVRLLLAPQLTALDLTGVKIQPSQPPDGVSDAESDSDRHWNSSGSDTDTDTSDDDAPADFLSSTEVRPALQRLAVNFAGSLLRRQGCGYNPVFDARHLNRIPDVWPNLCELELAGSVADTAAPDFSVLLLLTGLTKLSVGGGSAADSGGLAQQLTGFTVLKELQLSGEGGLIPEGLLPLRQLRGLTRLTLAGVGEGGWDDELRQALVQDHWRTTLVRSAWPSDVWQQLEQLCRRNMRCLAVLLQQAEQQLRDFRHQFAQQQQQRLAEKDAQLAVKETQLTQQAMQVAALQQQLGQKVYQEVNF